MCCTSKFAFLFLFFNLVLINTSVNAGFLDMPEITESLELKRKSMLRDINIPGVKDRDPDPTAGPRLAVKEFRVQGLVEYPELGITHDAINKLVEKIRFDLMAEDKLLDSGYTLDELGGLSDLLVDIEDDTVKRHVTPIEVQKLVWLIRDQRLKRGITLGQIESIADEITRFYRERGFILAKAYIPKQEVREGIVTLTLLLGMLGSVEVVNNKTFSSSTISSVFDSMLTKPVTSGQVEENLYLINDYPGLTVSGFFEAGNQVGDTKLNINVNEEEKFTYNIRLDNHGTDDTGRYRLYADAQINDLFGIGDYLNLSVLTATAPSNTNYWRANYQTKVFSPRIFFNYGMSTNQFVVDGQTVDTDLNGVVSTDEISVIYKLKRSRVSNTTLELKQSTISSDLQLGDTPDFGSLDEEISTTSFIYKFDFLQEQKKRLHQGSVTFTNGEYIFGNTGEIDKKFQYLTFDYNLLTFLKIPFTDSTSRLILRAGGQYSGDFLSSIAKYSLSGASRARAYSADVFSADDAFFASADLIFNSPDLFNFTLFGETKFSDMVKPFIFVDVSYGIQRASNSSDTDVNAQLVDAGVGLKINYKNKLQGNLHFAFPISDDFSDPDKVIKDNGLRVVFDFQYKF